MPKIPVLIFLITFCIESQAQSDPLSSIFWNSYSFYNPSNSGKDFEHFYSVQGRDQWSNIEGNPLSIWVIADMKIPAVHGGLGINYLHDEIGALTSDQFKFNYSYQGKLSENQMLALGFSLGFEHKRFDLEKFVAYDPIYLDPAIPKNDNASGLNMGIGMSYDYKKFSIGFGITNANQATFTFNQGSSIQNRAHYYFEITQEISLSEKLTLNPQIFIRIHEEYMELEASDINLRIIYADKYWVGSSIRIENTYVLMAGFNFLKKFGISYSYDAPPKVEGYIYEELGPSHEASLTFFIK